MIWPWKYIVISLLIGFFIGATAGILSSKALRHRWMAHGPELFMKRLDHEVHLSEAQKAQLTSLLKSYHDRLDSFHSELRQAVRRDARQLLTTDQQIGFDAFTARLDARR